MKLDIKENDKLWQIGSGDDSRDYNKVCFDFGVALVGPGNPGNVDTPKAIKYYIDNPNVKNYGFILKEHVKENNWIILRKGRKNIKAVGKVISRYKYHDIFQDVDGWDLQHYRNVEWYKPEKEIKFDRSILSMSPIEKCNREDVRNRLKDTNFERIEPKFKELSNLIIPRELKLEDLTNSFIDHGIRIQDSENIITTIRRIIYLVNWYIKHDMQASEHEIRTFLIIPLLIALGWSEQKIKIEYNNIDIAIFNQSFMGDYKTHPDIIVEAKKFENGLSFTKQYAKKYTDKFPDCTILITTNGYMYKYYEKSNEEFNLISYLNLLNLRDHHFLYNKISGALDCLFKMSNL